MEPKSKQNLEWLQTNGLGGFASGVVMGPPSRRYHGLLCASLSPPTDRHLLVSHLVESVSIDGDLTSLSSEHYLHHRPENKREVTFKNQPYAHWKYHLKKGHLEKSVMMVRGENTTLLRYKNTGALPLTLFLKPLLAVRDYHSLRPDAPEFNLDLTGNTIKAQTWGEPAVYLSSSVANWDLLDTWYHQLYYALEADRGFDAVEENYCPAELMARLAPGETLLLRFSTEPGLVTAQPFLEADKEYEKNIESERFKADIKQAAQDFIVHRESSHGNTILAGYPWFTDWGRDTLIALRDFQDFITPLESQRIIKTFLQYEDNGLIPNRFPDDSEDEIEYNTVDATLWLFVVVWELQKSHSDKLFIEEIFPALTRIMQAHMNGTNFGIKVLESCLLSAGEFPWQLTWMDAKIGDHTVTPRRGSPVEINALWYNTLKIYAAFQKDLKDSTLEVRPMIKMFEKNFTQMFWDPQNQSLYDLIDEDGKADVSMRPNQIYALSLPFTILTLRQQKSVLQQISEKLYTPLGLRTLAVDDDEFKPLYAGDTWARDTAYHQGTVWPFLVREYWVAYEKINGSKKTKALMTSEIEALKHHFYNDAGVGSVSEVFDGLDPKHGKGCPQQAWSVAALWKMVKMLES